MSEDLSKLTDHELVNLQGQIGDPDFREMVLAEARRRAAEKTAHSKWSYIIPSVATIAAGAISAYVAYLGIQVTKRDLGSLDEGQKICVVANTGTWHNITVVPKNWTVSMCKQLGTPFEADTFYIGCGFRDEVVFSGKSDLKTPSPNCGW